MLSVLTGGILRGGMYVALRLITKSNMGLGFKALGQDMEAARYAGINPLKYRTINFVISCFIAGICGGFYAHYVGVMTPSGLATTRTIEILVYAYVGGRASLWGPLLATFILLPTFDLLNSLNELKYVIYGIVLIVVMIYFPGGISSLVDRAKAKIAARRNNTPSRQ